MMDLGDILCSIQRALLGNVTPNLRAVNVKLKGEHAIELIFYYDEQPDEDEEELANLTDTEFMADFPSPEFSTGFKVLTIPYPQKIPDEGRCVYLRFEKK
ncbi:MAG: hypothetical protein K0S07_621 [Chlamydiales bacterium]|nr:hypothetical protein [Chlamydiales bacterium]